jgi:hypothetical protein
MAVTKSTLKGRFEPQRFPSKHFGDDVIVKPMSAKRRSEIDARFDVDERGKIINKLGYAAALIAEMVVGDDGQPAFVESDLTADTFADSDFNELSRITSDFLGVKKDGDSKN